uniref:Iron-sulfur cluster formation ABC transporter n=1 Tax=Astrosyne radiata TaxID=1158023 RepID=A0A2U9NT64_9STRA|nr:iron-sulfur cluster formation ABC transporter [Astrosyne radiata]AWT40321.1 iron-sulfur cluster formation ABC transporter [Astrosyne radiata]
MAFKQHLLKVNKLKVSVNNNIVLNDLNLTVNPGEIHAIMGPNGSGKSTLSKVIAGHPVYKIVDGNIFYKNFSLLNLTPEERSHLGIFLSFQYPIEIPGVSNLDFLRLAYNSKRQFYKQNDVNPIEFLEIVKNKASLINMSINFLTRNVNEGFSGGEKKRNEILQMILLDSELSILDEIDSGLDIDALKIISTGINNFMNEQKAIILITHYQRLLEYINPTYVHVMQNGKIIKTGPFSLAKTLEQKGYKWLEK